VFPFYLTARRIRLFISAERDPGERVIG